MQPWPKTNQSTQRIGWRTLVTKQFTLPDGSSAEYVTVHGIGEQAVAVVALTADNQVIIARQFRPGPERILDELPGGMVDVDEEPTQAIRRELLEETGYTSKEDLITLGSAMPDAYSNATCHYYLLQNCEQTDEQRLDDGELVEPVLISLQQLRQNVTDNNVSDPLAVLLALEKLKA